MIWQVIIKPSAQIDIDEAFIWYEQALDNLGFEFLVSLDATIELIRRNPSFASFVYNHVRSTTLMRFPFSVYYMVEQDKIFVLAVLHHSRNPKEFRKRV